ncbi:MAG TPA: LPS assembly lipoprotein LptE [Bryobacteraceae bacterium]|nr:LPS assembly lipoprotein LptE [Bryobacteraceae bacterium]
MRQTAVTCLIALSVGCGYRVGVRDNALPSTLQTIAIPPFTNATARYRLTDTLPSAVAREFLSRTRYRIVSDEGQADAVLRGSVLNYGAYVSVIDQQTGRSTGAQVTVAVSLSLFDRRSGKVLWSRPSMEFRQRYEMAIDPRAYFEESDVGLERLSNEVARSVVSAVLEAF